MEKSGADLVGETYNKDKQVGEEEKEQMENRRREEQVLGA